MLARRSLLATTLALTATGAHATDYPTQDIKFIIPYGAGGGFDLYVRAVAPALQKHLPNPVQVIPDNVPAGGGVLGIGQLFRARPDGATIGVLNIPGLFILQKSGGSAFDLAKFSYLGMIGQDTYAIAVAETSPIKSIADLRALSAERPVKFTATGHQSTAYAATVIAMHLLGVRVQMIAGYKGSSDYVVAALRGDGDAVVADLPVVKPMVAGKLMRVLATFEPHSTMPGAEDATTLGLPDLADLVVERVVAAPPKLPAGIQAILSDALVGALADPSVIDLAQRFGSTLQTMSPKQTSELVMRQAAFFEKWKSLLEA